MPESVLVISDQKSRILTSISQTLSDTWLEASLRITLVLCSRESTGILMIEVLDEPLFVGIS